MKTSTKVILAGLAVAITAGGAFAADGWRKYGRDNPHRFGKQMFEQADADKDGAISLDELMQALAARFDQADADSNAAVTKAEIINAVEEHAPFERAKRFSGRIADRLVYQLDLDGNGNVARSELENRAKKVFALFDWDDNGRVEMAEIRRVVGGMGRRHGMGGPRWHAGFGPMHRMGGFGPGADMDGPDGDQE